MKGPGFCHTAHFHYLGELMRIAVAGATGRTGRELVRQALSRGYSVTALTRSGPQYEAANLNWANGRVEDLDSIRRLVDGADIAISAVGPTSMQSNACSISTSNLVASGIRRLIIVSGQGVTLPDDRKGVIDRIVSFLVRRSAPEIFADKVRELDVLRLSQCDWTAARVGALLNGRVPRPAKAHLTRPPGQSIDTASLAAWCLDEVEHNRFVRQAPFVSN